MIIFGFRNTLAVLAMVLLQCNRCGMPANQRVQRMRYWFTLFFIPVIPLRTTYFMTCAYCGSDTRIRKEDAERLQASQHGPDGTPSPAPQQQQAGYGQPPHGQQAPRVQGGYAQYGAPQPPPQQWGQDWGQPPRR
jgi:hypothetical protein